MIELIKAEDARKQSTENKQHYREEERTALLINIDKQIKDAIAIGEFSCCVEVDPIDQEFVKEILKKYGYESINMCRDGFVTTMEISWDN